MTAVAIVSSTDNNQIPASVTAYGTVGNGAIYTGVAEANSKVPFRTAGVLSKLTVRIKGNTIVGSSTITIRKNGADGNQTITIPGATTGEFTDASNTDTVTAGDQFDLKFVGGASGTRMNPSTYSLIFAATSGTMEKYNCNGNVAISADSTTYFMPFAGKNESPTTTEANVKSRFHAPGTLKNGYVVVQTNARSTNTTVKSRKNGADGNISITIPGGSTGIFEDTSNTDTIADGDDLNFSLATLTGGGNFVCCMGAEFIPDANSGTYPFIVASVPGAAVAAATTYYCSIGGYLFPDSVAEANTQIQTGFAWIARNMFCYVSANTGVSGNTTITLRKNAADGNSNITIPAGTTGLFEDTTNSDTIVSTDDVNYKIIGAVGGITTLNVMGIHARFPITFNETLSAGVTCADALAVTATFNPTLANALTVADSLAVAATFNPTLSNAITVADALAVAATFAASISDGVTVADALAVAVTFNASVSDSITAADSVAAAATFNAPTSAGVTLADALSAVATFNPSVNENTTLADALTAAATFNASLTAGITVADSLAVALVISVSVLEAVTVADSVLAAAIYNATLLETLVFQDQLAVAVQFNPTLAEAITLSDLVTVFTPSNTPKIRILIPTYQNRVLCPKRQIRVLNPSPQDRTL